MRTHVRYSAIAGLALSLALVLGGTVPALADDASDDVTVPVVVAEQDDAGTPEGEPAPADATPADTDTPDEGGDPETPADPETTDISGATVTVADQHWTGAALEPEVTVTLDGTTLTEDEDYTVSYENNVRMGTATVTVTGTGTYAGTAETTFEIGAPDFVDVTTSTAHANDIAWLAEQGVTQGWARADGTREFRPGASVARGDMAAFLYRLAGSPDYTAPARSPFTDVSTATSHYKEICWLASEGISTGWSNGNGTYSFRPSANIARGDMAAFLYRLAGSPAVAGTSQGFSDVSTSTSHWREILWMQESGLATGWADSNGTRSFRPNDSIARGDMAAFLHRQSAAGLVAPGTDASAGATSGWVRRSGSWYWLENGSPATGWRSISGSYFLFASDGRMLTGFQTVNGKYYLLGGEGAMLTGWQTRGGKTYLFQSDGSAYTGWYQVGTSLKYYYFDPDDRGAMVTGTKTINGKTQNFRSNGVWAPSSGVKHLDDICDWIIDNVTGYGADNYDALRKLYDWARRRTYIHGNEYPAGGWRTWSIPYAQQMWDNGGGNCYRYASIVCWTARRLGYDANTVSGWVPTYSGRAAHGWCEVHINGQTYIIDASLGRHVTSRSFFMVQYGNAPTTYHVISR